MTTVRRAGPGDIDALVELRRVMFEAMGSTGSSWEQAARNWFRDALPRMEEVAAFVVQEADGSVVCCALGITDRRPPSPSNPSGKIGSLSNVSTLPDWRRRGHARTAVTALLSWFDDLGVPVVRLNATSDGEGLYRSLGFSEHTTPFMLRGQP